MDLTRVNGGVGRCARPAPDREFVVSGDPLPL